MTPAQLVEFVEGLARIAASGGGPKALAAHLAEVADAGVLVEDADWRHLAAAGDVPLPATGRPSANSAQAHEGLTIPIAAGQAQFGWLSFVPRNAADTETYAVAARLCACAIAVELARDQAGGRGRRRTFWERLIARTYHDVISAREDAIARGILLASHYVAIALEPDVTDEEHGAAQLADVRAVASAVFRASDAELGMIDRGATLIVLVPATREIDVENAKTAAVLLPKTAAKKKPGLRVSGGTSPPAALLEVHRGVEQAEAALAIARRVYGGGRVSPYEDLGVYPLLYSGASVEALKTSASNVLAPLRDYDDKHQTELERTLRLYFDTGQNVKTTAMELNVHRHTVFYRLRQINDITGRSLESAHDQLTLRLAIAIDELHK
jgi:PucR family transcriptional regulator, purine catabolism regulatory protein